MKLNYVCRIKFWCFTAWQSVHEDWVLWCDNIHTGSDGLCNMNAKTSKLISTFVVCLLINCDNMSHLVAVSRERIGFLKFSVKFISSLNDKIYFISTLTDLKANWGQKLPELGPSIEYLWSGGMEVGVKSKMHITRGIGEFVLKCMYTPQKVLPMLVNNIFLIILCWILALPHSLN